jgi:hypothetical protein
VRTVFVSRSPVNIQRRIQNSRQNIGRTSPSASSTVEDCKKQPHSSSTPTNNEVQHRHRRPIRHLHSIHRKRLHTILFFPPRHTHSFHILSHHHRLRVVSPSSYPRTFHNSTNVRHNIQRGYSRSHRSRG